MDGVTSTINCPGLDARTTQGQLFTGIVADFTGRLDASTSDFEATVHLVVRNLRKAALGAFKQSGSTLQ